MRLPLRPHPHAITTPLPDENIARHRMVVRRRHDEHYDVVPFVDAERY